MARNRAIVEARIRTLEEEAAARKAADEAVARAANEEAARSAAVTAGPSTGEPPALGAGDPALPAAPPLSASPRLPPAPSRPDLLPSSRATEAVSAAMPPQDQPRPLYERPWFWGVVGGVVLGAAAIAVAVSAGGTNPWDCGATCNLSTRRVPGP